jgi:hypothetical protein
MTSQITDFDDRMHRVESASAVFQKGLYHLFVLKKRYQVDIFSQILRVYQSLFQVCITQLLLDFDFSLNNRYIHSRLTRRCKNPERPTRKELDPASIVTHTMLERTWKGFQQEHPLKSASEYL